MEACKNVDFLFLIHGCPLTQQDNKEYITTSVHGLSLLFYNIRQVKKACKECINKPDTSLSQNFYHPH